jgi:hypothetical protein
MGTKISNQLDVKNTNIHKCINIGLSEIGVYQQFVDTFRKKNDLEVPFSDQLI